MRRILALRPVQLVAAVLLIAVSPVVGLIPGPGGVFVFAGGLVLLLRNSRWARRQFARAKRRWPRLGTLVDRALRRGSAQRRRALAAQAGGGAVALTCPPPSPMRRGDQAVPRAAVLHSDIRE